MFYFILSRLFLFTALFGIGSCSKNPCNYPVMGADEFVIDSYKIREGKMAILAMEGERAECYPPAACMVEYPDVIAEDDVLNIVIYHPSRKDLMEAVQFINEYMEGFRVTNGRVDLPDIEAVGIVGLSLEEAQQLLQRKYREHIKDVEVFISYRERLAHKVELTGMVERSTIPVDGKIRLYDVVSKAKISPGANLFMSYVSRDGALLPIDFHRLINKGDMQYNIVMRANDKIFIAYPADAVVMVMGEVFSPQAVKVPYGYISLREAIVSAGGIPFTGDRRRIQIIRGNLMEPKLYVLSWEHIVHLPNRSLLLMPGDTVYISETPITQWNRFIEQLLPSMNTGIIGYNFYRGVRN